MEIVKLLHWNVFEGLHRTCEQCYCITSTCSVTNVKYIVSVLEDNMVKKCDLQQKIRVHDNHSDFVISVTWVRIALLLQALIMI
ncbi:hypothetical protein CMV_002892 [Castanea mollissima]|uniref:Uncharacterized protein n=1 Tax=Castanea mollissima TaxID=60419 RepID=A0A8J4RV22_9ROSI|nr:hypothetical protein CMV_002892 [Castanea mollissima]